MHDGYEDDSGISNGFKDEKAIKKERNFSPNFVVVWRKLVEELLHAVLLPHRVHIRHLVVREGGEEEVHLGWWSVLGRVIGCSFSWIGSRVCLLQCRTGKVLINGGLKSEGVLASPSWTLD